MTRLRKHSVFRPRVIQPPPADDTRGATPERVRHAQGFVERGNLGRGRTGLGVSAGTVAVFVVATILAIVGYVLARSRR